MGIIAHGSKLELLSFIFVPNWIKKKNLDTTKVYLLRNITIILMANVRDLRQNSLKLGFFNKKS